MEFFLIAYSRRYFLILLLLPLLLFTDDVLVDFRSFFSLLVRYCIQIISWNTVLRKSTHIELVHAFKHCAAQSCCLFFSQLCAQSNTSFFPYVRNFVSLIVHFFLSFLRNFCRWSSIHSETFVQFDIILYRISLLSHSLRALEKKPISRARSTNERKEKTWR